ncbi:MAG: hypothetical protein RMK29_10025 [Myxococcales bacterium]|nr:hypothetical protein [Myxococcota bacterium]MDW8282039.1 hypothetical protein [Myxococcales bacterium]
MSNPIAQPVLTRMLLEAVLEGGPKPKDPIGQRRLRWLPEWLRVLLWQQVRTTPQEVVQAFLVSMHAQGARLLQRASPWEQGGLPLASASPLDAGCDIETAEIPAHLLTLARPPRLANPEETPRELA